MTLRQWLCATLFFLGLVVVAGTAAVRAQQATAPVVHPRATLALGPFPNVPTCLQAAAESGDPAKGAATFLATFAPGCVVPWHWHTPDETILAVSGSLRVEMKGGDKPVFMRGGDYAMMPSHHIHQARCVSTAPCTMFLHSSGIFDLHYVNASGAEIPMSEAVKPASMGHKMAPKKEAPKQN